MAMRPLDRLTSIRAKLGSVIVFAVAVTILIMYVAIGFALRKSDRDREFRAAVAEAKGLQTLAFGPTGTPIQPTRLQRLLVNAPNNPTGWTLSRGGRTQAGSAPACGGCEQAKGAGALDGLAAPVRAELRVQVVHVGLDGVR